MSILLASMYMHHMGAWGSKRQKTASDSQELGLQMVISYNVVARSQTQVSRREASALKPELSLRLLVFTF